MTAVRVRERGGDAGRGPRRVPFPARWRAGLLVACVASLGAAPPPGSKTADEAFTPPVALLKPMPVTPTATAGTGLTPLVRLKLSIDASGRVTAVEVLEIDPPSAYDNHFREEAVRAMSRWRFEPARRDGRPVPTDLTWAIRFTALESRPESADSESEFSLSLISSAGPDEARDLWRRDILMLPRAQRERLLADLVATAEQQITPAERREASNDGWVVVTDLSGDGVEKTLLQNLAATFSFAYEILSPAIPDQPAQGKMRAYVFRSKAQYQALVSSARAFEWTGGFYHPAGFLAFHSEVPAVEFLLSILIHESTHALLDRHIARPGVLLPRWLDEGFAEYMGNSDIEGGKLVPGRHRKAYTARRMVPGIEGATVRTESMAKAEARVAKRAVRERSAPELAQLFAVDSKTFYGEDRDLFYSQSWLAVHFLRHGRPGWAADQFPRFFLYAAEGYPAGEAFRRVYGLEPTVLDEEFRAYVKKF